MQFGFLKFSARLCTAAILVGGLAGGVSATPVFGQATQKTDAAKPISSPDERTLTTKDGQKIKITYYKSTLGKDAAVIVLLHMKDGNRFIWQGDKGLAERLQKEGYAVITVDLRGHGESKSDATPAGNANQDDKKKKPSGGKKPDLKPVDVQLMVNADMEAVKGFIYDEHQAENLNMNKLGIVGPELGASIAVEYALLDWYKKPHSDGQPGFQTPRGQDVHALVLISPQSTFHGVVMPKPLTELKNPNWKISFLICTGNDQSDKAQAKKLFEQITKPEEKEKRMYNEEFNSKLKGTDLLGKGLKIEDTIVGFFNKHLKRLDSPWRDRRSKLDR